MIILVYKNFDQLLSKSKRRGKIKKVAVVAADDMNTLEAVIKAKADGLIEPILIGDKEQIKSKLHKLNIEDGYIIHANNVEDAAIMGVKLVSENAADFIMKGKLETKDLLKAVVNKKSGLGTGRLMSHIAIHELPWYKKLLITTDGGMTMYPTVEQKKEIIQNSVDILIKLGYDCPKVAVLAAVEKVNPKMFESVEAAELKDMYLKGDIKDSIVEGPISFDLAVNKDKAIIKGYNSEVAGDADILILPNITAGNILGKSLLEVEGVKMAGLIIGAKVPIVLTSRGSSFEEKYLSLALAALTIK